MGKTVVFLLPWTLFLVFVVSMSVSGSGGYRRSERKRRGKDFGSTALGLTMKKTKENEET